MKEKFILSFLSAVLLSTLTSCFDPPEYSNIPEISFDNIRFVDVDRGSDSLILSFNFTDGDGDLGLNSADTLSPYHSYNFILDGSTKFAFNEILKTQRVIDSTVRFVEFNDSNLNYPLVLVDKVFGTYQGIYMDQPAPLPPFNCKNYLIFKSIPDSGGNINEDTLLIEANDANKNIRLEFYRKRNGQYTNITQNLSPNDCQDSFNARFPIFDSDNIGRPLKGTIYYPILSSAFKPVFLNDSIMIEYFIYDRSLNKSNVARTIDFTLPGLLGIN